MSLKEERGIIYLLDARVMEDAIANVNIVFRYAHAVGAVAYPSKESGGKFHSLYNTKASCNARLAFYFSFLGNKFSGFLLARIAALRALLVVGIMGCKRRAIT